MSNSNDPCSYPPWDAVSSTQNTHQVTRGQEPHATAALHRLPHRDLCF